MVWEKGVEPSRYFYQWIFILLYVTIAALLRCSLDYVFTISLDLGDWYIVSTLLFGAVLSTIRIC